MYPPRMLSWSLHLFQLQVLDSEHPSVGSLGLLGCRGWAEGTQVQRQLTSTPLGCGYQ